MGRGKATRKRRAGSKVEDRRSSVAPRPPLRSSRLISAAKSHLDFAAAAIAAMGFAFHLFSTGDYFIGSGTDLVSHEFPMHVFATSWLARGVLPLWNPYIFCGVPFQAGVHGYLYPGWWTGVVLPVGLDIKVGILLHLAVAALGGVWLARGRVKSGIASFVCGAAFAFSGFTVMHLYAGHRVMVATASFLPWIAGALDRAGRGRRRYLAHGAAICGLMVLCGHYQVIFIGMGGLALFFVLERLLGQGDYTAAFSGRLRSAGGAMLIWCAVLAAGLLISAVQLLPMLSTVEMSQRAGGSSEFASSYSSSLPNLLTYLSPNLFGNKVDAPFVGGWSFWESNGYMGLLTIQLILLCMSTLSWRRWAPAVTVILLALILSMGASTRLFELYLELVPGADLFRSPGRFCLLATLLGSLMAAESIDAWITGGALRARRAAIAVSILFLPAVSLIGAVALGFVDASAFGEWMTGLTDGGGTSRPAPGSWQELLVLARSDSYKAVLFTSAVAAMVLIGGGRPSLRRYFGVAMAVILFADLYGFGRRFMLTAPKDRFHMAEELVEAIGKEPGERFIPPARSRWWNWGIMSEIGSPGGYDTFIDGRYARYLNRSQGRPLDRYFSFERIRRGSPLIRHLSARFLVTTEQLQRGRNRTVSGFSDFELLRRVGGLYLYENNKTVPRAVVVHHVERIGDEDAIYRRLEDPGFDMREAVVVEGDLPSDFEEPEPLPDGASESARIALYEPNRVEIEVKAASKSVLVLSDSFHPGWSAEVDGEEVPVARVNAVMRAVPVPPGEHRVVMTFMPRSFLWGGAVSCLSLVGLIVWIATTGRRRESVKSS